MIRLFPIAVSALALLATPAFAAPAAAPKAAATIPAPRPAEDLVRVALDTQKGRIVLDLDRGRAPVTTANFLRYIDAKRFDGVGFYRAMPNGAGNGLIQAGIRNMALLYPAIAHEPASKTGIKHEAGTILMANFGPGTARSDFFITIGPIPFKDDFAPFGRVVEGLDVVKAIFASPTDPEKGVGIMKGQMLAQPVLIKTARRVPTTAVAAPKAN